MYFFSNGYKSIGKIKNQQRKKKFSEGATDKIIVPISYWCYTINKIISLLVFYVFFTVVTDRDKSISLTFLIVLSVGICLFPCWSIPHGYSLMVQCQGNSRLVGVYINNNTGMGDPKNY
jgi:hypothetical protein